MLIEKRAAADPDADDPVMQILFSLRSRMRDTQSIVLQLMSDAHQRNSGGGGGGGGGAVGGNAARCSSGRLMLWRRAGGEARGIETALAKLAQSSLVIG